jgi:hypothetical protein
MGTLGKIELMETMNRLASVRAQVKDFEGQMERSAFAPIVGKHLKKISHIVNTAEKR